MKLPDQVEYVYSTWDQDVPVARGQRAAHSTRTLECFLKVKTAMSYCRTQTPEAWRLYCALLTYYTVKLKPESLRELRLLSPLPWQCCNAQARSEPLHHRCPIWVVKCPPACTRRNGRIGCRSRMQKCENEPINCGADNIRCLFGRNT